MKPRKSFLKILLLFSTLYALCSTLTYAEPPNLLTYQGRLKESGQPVTGTRSVDIWLWKQLSGGTEGVDGFSTGNQPVSISNGLFRSTFTVPSSVNLETGDWYLELRVNSVIYSPREKLTSSAYAVYSASSSYANNLAAASGATGIFVSSSVFVTQGNVGIGTTSPTAGYELHIKAQGTDNGDLRVESGGGTSLGINANNSGYGNIQTGVGGVNGGNLVLQEAAGNVGIGTTSPSGILHVGGGTDSQIFVGSVSDPGWVDTAIQLGANYGYVASRGNLNLYSNLFENGVNTTFIQSNGAARILVNGTGGGGIGAIYFQTYNSGTAGTTAFATHSSIYKDGNVGIGTVSPEQKLTVSGNISQTGIIISSGTGNNYFAGNVGIGTTNPSNRVHVVTNPVTAPVNSMIALLVEGYYIGLKTPNNSEGGIIWSSPTGGESDARVMYNTNAGDRQLQFFLNGQNRVIVKQDGKVGISTGTPLATLHVNGDIGLGDGTLTGNQPVTIWLKNVSGIPLSSGTIVTAAPGSSNSFTTVNVPSTTTVLGVVYEPSCAAASSCRVAVSGVVTVQNCNNGPVSPGQHVVTSSELGKATGNAIPTAGASIGIWIENVVVSGSGKALLR